MVEYFELTSHAVSRAQERANMPIEKLRDFVQLAMTKGDIWQRCKRNLERLVYYQGIYLVFKKEGAWRLVTCCCSMPISWQLDFNTKGQRGLKVVQRWYS